MKLTINVRIDDYRFGIQSELYVKIARILHKYNLGRVEPNVGRLSAAGEIEAGQPNDFQKPSKRTNVENLFFSPRSRKPIVISGFSE